MKVKIKTWERMEQEFGLDSYGDIQCDMLFTSAMEDAMPHDRILAVYKNNQGDYVCDLSTSNNCRFMIDCYYINEDMIEEYL